MGLRSFQAKLIYLIVGVLVLLQTAILAAVHISGKTTVRTVISEELDVADRVLQGILDARGRQNTDRLRLIAADFAFREVIALGDEPTIRDVLNNHGARVRAARAFVLSLDGDVIADTLTDDLDDRFLPFWSVIERTERGGDPFGVLVIDGRPYQVVVAPVLAPQPIAWVSMAFSLDESLLDEIRRLTATDVSLWVPNQRAGSFLISTLGREEQRELLEQSERGAVTSDASEPVVLGGASYQTAAIPLQTVDDSAVIVFLKRSIEEAQMPFRRLELQIFILSSLALLTAVATAVVVARGVSRPLQRLAREAGKIERGDYSTSLAIRQRDEVGKLAAAFNNMRTAIAEREEKIRHQATHDELTGLPNRTLFLDRLGRAIATARRSGSLVGMIMMDLDRFKEINDTLGHHFGDEVLISVGHRLTETLRESDTVARLGGDEFAVTFFTDSIARSEEVAGRIREELQAPHHLGEVTIEVEASMGIAVFPAHAGDAATLMKLADVAMYDAKKRHSSFAIYEPGRDEHSLRRLAILSELRNAVASDELELVFQPKIDMMTRKAVHVEALVRWRHPVHGVLAPAEFVPLAEQSGNIAMITKWVLRNAIRHCSEWNAEGIDLSVAVNLSALDLFDADLPGTIRTLLDDAGLPAEKLVLEITESAVMSDPTHAKKILGELKNRGITIAIDDYGTGYSSLAHLKQLPADELKIDKSFILSLRKIDSEDGFIVRSTIDLGHTMGLKVIAEGVETAASFDILDRLGCDMAQGYYIAHPLPAGDLRSWMSDSEWGRGGQNP